MQDTEFKNFKNFLWMIWDFLKLPNPSPVQYDIADFLQTATLHRKIIEAFRGVGKTWVTAAYACWLLYLNKNEKILIVSATKDKALEISTFIKRLISDVPMLQHLQPNTHDDDRDSKTSFDVAGCIPSVSPSVKVLGVRGQLTGCRATRIIADDIETSENCQTQLMRDAIQNAVDEFDNIIVPGGDIIYLGTPHTSSSLYSKLEGRGYVVRIWPARYPSEREAVEVYKHTLGDIIVNNLKDNFNKPTWPERFSEDVLIDKEGKIGSSKFRMQFMLDTSSVDADVHPLKLSDLIILDLHNDKASECVSWGSNKELLINDLQCVGLSNDRYYKPFYVADHWLPYMQKLLAIDPSGRGRDETGYAVLGSLNGMIFVLDCCGIVGGYDDNTLHKLGLIAKEYKVNEVIIESNFGNGMYTQLFIPVLRQYHSCSVEEVTHNKQKELRMIDTLEPVMNRHKLIINKRIIDKDYQSTRELPLEIAPQYQLFYQLTRLTRDRGCLTHDDRLDALSIGVARLIDTMSLDPNVERKRRLEEEHDKEVEDWLARFGVNGKPSNPSWFK